jgi:hypothetical protein
LLLLEYYYYSYILSIILPKSSQIVASKYVLLREWHYSPYAAMLTGNWDGVQVCSLMFNWRHRLMLAMPVKGLISHRYQLAQAADVDMHQDLEGS